MPDSSPGAVISSGALGKLSVPPTCWASESAPSHVSMPSDSGPNSEYRSPLFRQVTSPLAGLVMTVMPSNAIASSTYSMPFFAQASPPPRSIGREASLMSVSPSQNRTNPSPVPGPSTVIETSEDTSSLKSSATRLVIGSTVEEPEIVIVPLRS